MDCRVAQHLIDRVRYLTNMSLHSRQPGQRLLLRRSVAWISGLLAVLVSWLTAAGTTHGVHRYQGLATPDRVVDSRWVLPVCGGPLGGCLLLVAMRLLRLLTERTPRALRQPRR